MRPIVCHVKLTARTSVTQVPAVPATLLRLTTADVSVSCVILVSNLNKTHNEKMVTLVNYRSLFEIGITRGLQGFLRFSKDRKVSFQHEKERDVRLHIRIVILPR